MVQEQWSSGHVDHPLTKHQRFKLHFAPTSASWMNLVERFFADITSKRTRRGNYSSVDDLEGAIYDYLPQHNAEQRAKVGDGLRGGLSWRCSDAFNSHPGKG